LDPNGQPTADRNQAGPDDNTNFNLTLDALKDGEDRLMYTMEKDGVLTLMDPQPGDAGFVGQWKNGQSIIVDNGDGTYSLSTYQKAEDGKWYEQKYTKAPSERVHLDDNDLYGALQAQRELLTEEGEFSAAATIGAVDENAASKRGIRYYQKALDLLANQFATAMNEANTGFVRNEKGEYIDANGATIQYNGAVATSDMEMTPELRAHLAANGGQQLGGVLFSNHGDGDDPTGITASNISISLTWSKNNIIVNSYTKPEGMDIATTDSSNILHMVQLFNTKMDYDPSVIGPANGDVPMFHGTFQEMWTNIGSTLGNDMMETGTMLDTFYTSSVQLDTSRDSVSSVDLNDEAMNLMQYSKSYDAACRLMTTIDSILDKLINGTGMTR
jgi:flagellar hook-associated protein 1 FlgK